MLLKEDYALIFSKSCEYFQIDIYDLVSKSRKARFVEARRIICHEIRSGYPFETLEKISSFFGDRHHSTIVAYLDTYDDLIRYHNVFATKAKEFKAYFNAKIAPFISVNINSANKYASLIEKKERLIELQMEILEIEKSIYLDN